MAGSLLVRLCQGPQLCNQLLIVYQYAATPVPHAAVPCIMQAFSLPPNLASTAPALHIYHGAVQMHDSAQIFLQT
jgi:hypothetical protein